tara:strand:- start:1126 stop:1905 length:780 start_codon:yes stop_codon:yes gene_type:complete
MIRIKLSKIINIAVLFSIFFMMFFTNDYIEAHKPFFPDPAPTIEESILILNPDISQVFYFILNNKNNEFWIQMKLKKGHNLILDLGAPKFLELKNVSPELYLYQQLDDKGFSELYSFIPGSKHMVTEFHEPFTDTYSWVYLKKRFVINEEGNYFVKIKSSVDMQTKVWFATGIIEDFGITDLINFAGTRSDVKNFHKSDEISELEKKIIIPESPAITKFENNNIISVFYNKITNLNIYFIIIIVSVIITMIYFTKYKLK